MPFNLPIALTWLRVAAIPLLVAIFYLPNSWLSPFDQNLFATILFVSAAITDWLDGFLARRLKQESAFGQFLDPVADKLLVSSTLLLLAGFDRISRFTLIPAIVILCREIMVSGLREYLSELKVNMPVTPLAKWKTAVQMIAISFLLLGDSSVFGKSFLLLGEGLLWAAAVMTLISGFNYLKANAKHF